MQKRILALWAMGLVLLGTSAVQAQPFTRIDTGVLVSDQGDSRSVNFVDYDHDGDLDLFVSNGPQAGFNNFLYRNDGAGVFTRMAEGSIVSDQAPSVGTTWGDYDNDGDLDLYVTNWYGRPNQLYANNGDGTFDRISAGPAVTDVGFSEAASWGDYDADGDLDLYVTNWYGRPNQLYANKGDGTFDRIATGPAVTDAGFSEAASWGDYDADGDLDLYVTNSDGSLFNALYTNNGDGSFTKVISGAPVTDTRPSRSVNWVDYDNDGDLDLFVANASGQHNALYANNSDGTFTALTEGPVVNDGGSSFGSAWGDYDNDGDLDLFVTNAFSGLTTNFLYANNGDGTFTRITDGPIADETGWTYGSAWGDYDDDGDLDLFIAKVNDEDNVLYRNDATAGNHWLTLTLIGTASNTSAIGAIVRVKATMGGVPVWQMREVTAQSGYAGQNLRVHFGLGDTVVIDSLRIEWPSGQQQQAPNLPVDQLMTVTEGLSVGKETGDADLPAGYRLEANYPNPFNPQTTFTYTIPTPGYHLLQIHDAQGRTVETLIDGFQAQGTYTHTFDADYLTSGVYFYTLATGRYRTTRAMVVLR